MFFSQHAASFFALFISILLAGVEMRQTLVRMQHSTPTSQLNSCSCKEYIVVSLHVLFNTLFLPLSIPLHSRNERNHGKIYGVIKEKDGSILCAHQECACPPWSRAALRVAGLRRAPALGVGGSQLQRPLLANQRRL